MRFLLVNFIAALALVVHASAADLSPGEIKSAQKIYILKCTKCHELYDATKYSDEDWSLWMRKMKKKSKLKDEQFALLESYTGEIRSGKIEKPIGKKKK